MSSHGGLAALSGAVLVRRTGKFRRQKRVTVADLCVEHSLRANVVLRTDYLLTHLIFKTNPPSRYRYASVIHYSCAPLSEGDVFQDPQWTPEAMDSTEPYLYYTYRPMIKFNL